jgi:hypothetical protein
MVYGLQPSRVGGKNCFLQAARGSNTGVQNFRLATSFFFWQKFDFFIGQHRLEQKKALMLQSDCFGHLGLFVFRRRPFIFYFEVTGLFQKMLQ